MLGQGVSGRNVGWETTESPFERVGYACSPGLARRRKVLNFVSSHLNAWVVFHIKVGVIQILDNSFNVLFQCLPEFEAINLEVEVGSITG